MIVEPSESSEENAPSEQSQSVRKMTNIIMLAILAWGTFHMVGVYVFSREPDIRKPIIVYACVFAFVVFWRFLLTRLPK